MHRILVPLETAGSTGVLMMCGNGRVYRNYPIFAAFIGDYPEQILTTGSITGECPTCHEPMPRSVTYPEYPGVRKGTRAQTQEYEVLD